MPKRGGRDRGGSGYYRGHVEHDDRVPLPQDTTRRVSFKNLGPGGSGGGGGRRHKNIRQRAWDNKIRVLLDDDVDMSATMRTNERMNNYRQKHKTEGGGDWKKPKHLRTLAESATFWYKVVIRNGQRYPKDYLLKLLANFIQPQPLVHVGYKVAKDEASFVVDDYKTASQLFNADRRITAQDGWKLVIKVRPFSPMIEVDPKLSAAMKAVMAARYNPALKSLDLKKFHADPALVREDLFVPLNRPNLMMAALDIIAESIPDLLALDVSNNKIQSLEHMKLMIEKTPHLKVLHIGHNKLRDLKQLDALKGLPLEELELDGNSLCDKYTSQEEYIRDVRQRFPKVIKLDGTDLPPPILFDVEDEGTLPISQPSFLAAPEGGEMAKQFIQQYYQLFDSEGSREPLHQAYHEAAQFSYDVAVLGGDAILSHYMSENRNLLRTSLLDRRVKLLRVGKVSIIEALNNFPKTTHDPTSFIVDLVVFTPQLIQLNVCGLFTESGKKSGLRAFSRVFIIIPAGGGFCIVNDQLTVSQPTADQIKKVARLKAEAAAAAVEAAAAVPPPVVVGQSPVTASSPLQPQPPAAVPPVVDLVTRQQMVATLAASTGMNLAWSEKCLNETQWNYDQALFAFNKLHAAGSIPAEAFVK